MILVQSQRHCEQVPGLYELALRCRYRLYGFIVGVTAGVFFFQKKIATAITLGAKTDA